MADDRWRDDERRRWEEDRSRYGWREPGGWYGQRWYGGVDRPEFYGPYHEHERPPYGATHDRFYGEAGYGPGYGGGGIGGPLYGGYGGGWIGGGYGGGYLGDRGSPYVARPPWRGYGEGEGWAGGYAGGGEQGRSWWNRAADEVSSWMGDEGAERRRRMDRERGHYGKGPRGYIRSDERIREDVNDRLTDDWQLDASDIEVEVGNGEVALNGMVWTRANKRRAEELAETVSGVRHVQNNLRAQEGQGAGVERAAETAAKGQGATRSRR